MVVARRLAPLRGVVRAVALAVCFVAAICLVHLLPAMVDALARGVVLVLALAVAVAAELLVRRPAAIEPAAEFPAPAGVDRPWQLALGVAAAAAAAIWLTAPTLELIARPIYGSDATNFHLPTVATWIQDGNIWHPRQFVPEQAQAYYPNTGNLVELWAMLPWRSDFLVRLTSLPLIGLAAVSVFAAARELRATTATALLVASALAVIPIEVLAGTTLITPDPFMLATLAAGLLFLLRHARTREPAELVLAAVALGMAFGSRWHGLTAVVVVLAVWALAALVVVRPRLAAVRPIAGVGAIVLLVGGVWLVRNWIDQVSDQQWTAISAPLEPAVVIAGAGSGKTSVMAARVVYLVATGQVQADQVLGLTFTTKATAELPPGSGSPCGRWSRRGPVRAAPRADRCRAGLRPPGRRTARAGRADGGDLQRLRGRPPLRARTAHRPRTRHQGDGRRVPLPGRRPRDRASHGGRQPAQRAPEDRHRLPARARRRNEHLVAIDEVRAFHAQKLPKFEAALATSRAKADISKALAKMEEREEVSTWFRATARSRRSSG